MSFSPSFALLQSLARLPAGSTRPEEVRDAFARLPISSEQLDLALFQALSIIRDRFGDFAKHLPVPDVLVGDDEPEPYVSIRFPVPASPDEASELSWNLQSMLVERRLTIPGVTLSFAPAQDWLSTDVA